MPDHELAASHAADTATVGLPTSLDILPTSAYDRTRRRLRLLASVVVVAGSALRVRAVILPGGRPASYGAWPGGRSGCLLLEESDDAAR
jgi:hypothetical protein